MLEGLGGFDMYYLRLIGRCSNFYPTLRAKLLQAEESSQYVKGLNVTCNENKKG